MNKSDWMRIPNKRAQMPFGVEKEIDQSRKMGFVLIVIVVLAVATYAWIVH